MKIKTSELQGAALDWAVAKCERANDLERFKDSSITNEHYWDDVMHGRQVATEFRPSSDWSQGGPIIEREAIAWRKHSSGAWYAQLSRILGDGQSPQWAKHNYLTTPRGQEPALLLFSGPTPLIAAMRCFVASKLGDGVEIPEEITQ